jgi:hypothetical protein
MARGFAGFIERWFYWLAAVAMAAAAIYGFSSTIDAGLLHPPAPRPRLLYFHAAIFASWLLLYLLQASLVRLRQVRWHRRLGILGVVLGVAVLAAGVQTALVMTRFHLASDDPHADAFLVVLIADLLMFGIFFAGAVWQRGEPDRHRRLMFLATCALTDAAFGRFPAALVPDNLSYAAVDLLVVLAMGRDLLAQRRIHPVFLAALPFMVVLQAGAMYTYLWRSAWWLNVARWLLG